MTPRDHNVPDRRSVRGETVTLTPAALADSPSVGVARELHSVAKVMLAAIGGIIIAVTVGGGYALWQLAQFGATSR